MTPFGLASPSGKPPAQDEDTALDGDSLAQQLSEIALSLEVQPDADAMLGEPVRPG